MTDTNILIDYFADNLPAPGLDLIEEIIGHSLNVSVITQIEFLGWHRHSPDSLAAAEDIVHHASILHLTPEIVLDTISLKQSMRVKTPDAIIASTARIHNMTLITGNEKHFDTIPLISILNPWKIDCHS